MAGAKMGLGGGLSNLFGSDTSDLMEESLDNGIKNLPLAKIEPNPDQPSWQRAFACTASSHQSRYARARRTATTRSLQVSAAGVQHVRQA